MKQPIIVIDIDDVLANSTESVRLLTNQKYGLDLQAEHYKIPGQYWSYYETVWRTHGLEDIKLADVDTNMPHDQSHMLVHDQAIETIRALRQRYELVVLTARDLSWERATHVWLEQNFSGLFSKIMFIGGRAGLQKRSKGQVCQELGAEWLIDDNLDHAKGAVSEGVGAILFGEYGWHQDIPEDMVRCKDWQAVAEYFDVA